MIYMKKPVLFYQFDLDKFRAGQYSEGYFDYNNNAFGSSYSELDSLLRELCVIINRNCVCDNSYLEEHERIFPYYDTHNSERVYLELKDRTRKSQKN